MDTQTEQHVPTADCIIETIRVLNVAREIVYRAWTDPELLKIWWGPAGFTNTFNTFDFRVGGAWSFIMHAPDQGNFTNECEFTTIEPPALIEWKRYSRPLFNVRVVFEEISGSSTRVIFQQIFETVEECEKIRKFTIGKNEENFDRLEKVLATVVQQ